ncbi:hypothetical protein NEILACOT_03288 [Neisseria lactamica ATCC 23970]|uniref:Uncharacterized protein n=1 Tax=Neisseria lactamica ATCC 23970 TaxID=546265 RepID=D0W6Z5_NEILA|nr:hypothetical protein NEILACOT_03288 [Neisseria lactamica ATCC 23970]
MFRKLPSLHKNPPFVLSCKHKRPPARNHTAHPPNRTIPLSKRRCRFPIPNPIGPYPAACRRQMIKTKLYHKIHTT